jgi:ribosome-interacting GTPase 1
VIVPHAALLTDVYHQVYNKIDQITLEEVDRLAREPYTIVVSCESDLNLDYLVEQIWKHLNLLRIYTKRRGELPDFSDGLIIRNNASVEHAVCCCTLGFKPYFSTIPHVAELTVSLPSPSLLPPPPQCHAIHRTLVQDFRYALVWGTSTKHNPQRVGLAHVLENEDVLQVMKK